MRFKTVVAAMAIFTILISASIGDIFHIPLCDSRQLGLLSEYDVNSVLQVDSGYLVLAEMEVMEKLQQRGLVSQLIVPDITLHNLAIISKLEIYDENQYATIYEDSNVRLIEVPGLTHKIPAPPGIIPLSHTNADFDFNDSKQSEYYNLNDQADMDSLLNLVSEDSIESYILALETFPPRVVGSDGNRHAREWLIAKFGEFGYSAMTNPFTLPGVDGELSNVIAIKEGITEPNKYVIIGAHHDAVPDCPGADDNASGIAGVLEMARILNEYPTNLTFIFVAFDAEEVGLFGAYKHASTFGTGDSIIVMMNMDEIAYFGNSTTVHLFHGPSAYYANLYISLAQTTPSILLAGVDAGSSQLSDHYPYELIGYDVIFVHEPIMSHCKHLYCDSSVYLDYNYAARVIRGVLATALVVDDENTPDPILQFSYPSGIPETVSPYFETNFTVQIQGVHGGTLDPETPELHYSINGSPEIAIALTDIGNGDYEATLPRILCQEGQLSFYLSAVESEGVLFTDPDPSSPFVAVPATERLVAFEDDFEADKGWTISGGLWERGTPSGLGGRYGLPDPIGGHNSLSCFGYNLEGDYENNLPPAHLTSPPIDCSNLSGTKLKYWRWLGIESHPFDTATVTISNDGLNWTEIWENTGRIPGGAWVQDTFDISSIADGRSSVYIRFTMGPTDFSWVCCGWNIDDLEVYAYECSFICGDANGDAGVNIGDAVYIINFVFHEGNDPLPYEAGDANCDGNVNVGDAVYLGNVIFRPGSPAPCALCP